MTKPTDRDLSAIYDTTLDVAIQTEGIVPSHEKAVRAVYDRALADAADAATARFLGDSAFARDTRAAIANAIAELSTDRAFELSAS